MKKIHFWSILTLIMTAMLPGKTMAQAPEKFTYQAVVRNANNSLVINTQVGLRVNILQGSASGTTVYSESHIASTNANGLVTVNIGGGSVLHGSFADIDWSDGPYFLKTDIDPNGGNDYSITSVQQLLSVPYALYAKEAANSFSGDYNDLTNTPQIPQIPADISAFNNDAGYITAAQVPAQVNADWNATSGAAQILNKPTLFSGNYNDLTDKPVLFSGNYNDLINKPTIPTVPSNVSAFTNDAGYITTAQVPAQINADWNATSGAAQILNKPTFFSGNYNDLTNKPNLFSGSYNDLTNKPNLSTVAYSGSYNDLTNKPSIPTVVGELTNNVGYITAAQVPAQVNADWNATSGAAQILNKPVLFSGNYNDLSNKPVIPTVPANVSAFANDAGYITNGDLPEIPTVPTNVSAFSNDAGYLTGYTETDPHFNAWDKDYNDLTNKPTIPTVPTNVSAFTNDAGYLTSYTEQQVLSISHDTLFLTGGSFVKLPAGFSGDYNDLTNKPTIPTVPTNVSAFNNDAGYITGYTETDPQFNAWDKDYNDLINRPAIPAVPTNVSAFTNDAGYITAANVQEAANIPTNVSAFNNDAGYITGEDIPEIPTVPTNVSAFTNDAGYLTSYTETDPQFNAWDKNYNDLTNKPTLFSGNYNDLTNKPTLFDGNYNSLINKPNLATVATTGNYNDLVNKPALFSGNYNDLTNKPTIPTVNNATLTIQRNGSNVGTFTANQNTNQTVNITVPTTTSQLTNNSGYITISDVPVQVNADWNATNGAAQILNKPNIPTNVSQLNNDAGYITAAQCGDVDICAMANQLAQLQQQMSQMQARLDSLEGNTFTCGTSTVTDHEGNVYATVQIGNQCWMRDNLRTTTSPSTGTYLIPAANANLTFTGKQARWYNNDSTTYAPMNYGLLYNWNAAVDTFNTAYEETSVNTNSSNAVSVTFTGHRRGICPAGWHLPSDAEWTQLTDYVSSQSVYTCGDNSNYIAKALASTEGWNSYSGECYPGDQSVTANNATGFSAVPAGHNGSSFGAAGFSADFWSATRYAGALDFAYGRLLSCYNARVDRTSTNENGGRSVRCLRDETGGDESTVTLPAVSTNAVSGITATSANCGGNITSDGGASVTAHGVCWSTSQNPSVNGSHTTDGSGTGSFTSNITGLTANTTYYVRAYATNSVGTAYGNEVSFTTLSAAVIDSKSCPGTPTVTDHEGNVYATVQIGNQCWMRDNLRTTTSPSTGTYLIPAAGTGYTYTGKQAFWYNNDSTTYAPMNYGLLYNWNAAVDTFNTTYGETSVNTSSSNAVSVTFNGHRRGICPAGWHLPSDAEWTTLTDYVSSQSEFQCGGNSNYIAKALASTEGWNTYTNNCVVGNDPSTNNATGFSAVPAGYCYGSSFSTAGSDAVFWSSAQGTSINAYLRDLSYYYAGVGGGYANKYYGRSVRCLRDSDGGGESSATLPTVTTSTVSSVTASTATCGGNISSDGGASVTARGICWSTSQNPTVSNSHTTDGTGTGSFTSSITGLTANTTYYVRAYATNSVGTVYGNQVSFATTSSGGYDGQPCLEAATVTDIDGNTYNSVRIGNQCWMKENLRTTRYANGTNIALENTYTYSYTEPYRYVPGSGQSNEENMDNVPIYGYLYNWPAVMGNSSSSSTNPSLVQGICPTGWHVPSYAEWAQLINYVSSQIQFVCGSNNVYIGKALASTTGWRSYPTTCAVGNNPSSNNATGFSALPAGFHGETSLMAFGEFALFWSATKDGGDFGAYSSNLYYNGADMFGYSNAKSWGLSVRCVRDETALLPTVSTNTVGNITATSATGGGNVSSDGGASVIARGVCWSTSQTPTVYDNHTTDGIGTGSFTSNITGLAANTTYYVRAYAVNSEGTAYGEQRSFTTSSGSTSQDGQPCPETATVTDIDGNIYNSVQIGNQCWMKENLRTTRYANGTNIALGNSTSTITAYRYYPDNDSSNVSTYGYLYNWAATMHGATSSESNPSGVQGVCPTGWHVPSLNEWGQLIVYVSSQSQYLCDNNNAYIAKALASNTGWHSNSNICGVGNNPSTNNATGFSALPIEFYDGFYYNLGYSAFFGSASEGINGLAYGHYLNFDNAEVRLFRHNKSYGNSVRCLKD